MKKYIKDEKIYITPIKIVKNDKIIFTTDEKLIKEAGYEVYNYVEPKQSLDTLIQLSNERINKETDEKILNEFVWNGEEFYLTSENQQNFTNLFIAKDILSFPQTIKSKTGYVVLEDIPALTSFYVAGITFVKQCLEEGWQKKAEAEQEIRNNYK